MQQWLSTRKWEAAQLWAQPCADRLGEGGHSILKDPEKLAALQTETRKVGWELQLDAAVRPGTGTRYRYQDGDLYAVDEIRVRRPQAERYAAGNLQGLRWRIVMAQKPKRKPQ